MDEQKNNNPENLDYSFDFTNQVDPEQKTEVEETLTVEPAVEQQPDVSVPVMENAVVEETAKEAPAQEMETTEESVTVSEQPDVSVPVMEDTVAEQTTEEIKDGKSTLKFVIILVVIIVAFIIALPFALKFLGY